MIINLVTFTAWALIKVTLAAGFLWFGARIARVEKNDWSRAWICAALMYPLSLLLYNGVGLVPLAGVTTGLVITAVVWFPIVWGAFDTTRLKAAAVLAVGLLVYPGWSYGAF